MRLIWCRKRPDHGNGLRPWIPKQRPEFHLCATESQRLNLNPLTWTSPCEDWSQLVIDEMELFPKGRYDDLTDSTTMAVSFLRSSGILQTDAEAMAAEENTVMHRPQRSAWISHPRPSRARRSAFLRRRQPPPGFDQVIVPRPQYWIDGVANRDGLSLRCSQNVLSLLGEF